MCEIKVSIVCLTYNHAPYIDKALESILSQEVDFPIEVVIHDDCSTDGSQKIIAKWQSKYPDIIFPVFNDENQLQLGVDVFLKTANLARGKYIAYCETDDYWLDKNKLKKQVIKMDSDPSISLYAHEAIRVNSEGERLLKQYQTRKKEEYYFTTDEILKYDGGSFIPSASMMYRKEALAGLPDYYHKTTIYNDAPLTIYLSTVGKVYYDPTPMSVYRIFSKGSWSEKVEEKAQYLYDAGIDMLNLVDATTNYQYSESIAYRKNVMLKDLYERQKNVKKLYQVLMEKTEFTNSISFPKKVYLLIRAKLPITERHRYLILHPKTIVAKFVRKIRK